MTEYLGVFELPTDREPINWTDLQRAGAIALALEQRYFRTIWPGWPRPWCVHACAVVAPTLRLMLGWDVRMTITATATSGLQAVILTPDGDLIDPTYGMHDGGPALRILPAGQINALGHYICWPLTPRQDGRLRQHLGLASWPFEALAKQGLERLVERLPDPSPSRL